MSYTDSVIGAECGKAFGPAMEKIAKSSYLILHSLNTFDAFYDP